jgi:dTMP kinase
MTERGLFLTLEGPDGSGKTTQTRMLVERLRAAGCDVLETAEPGGTAIGRQIRTILLDAANQELRPTAELLLYFACRAQNVDETIQPALDRGMVVVSDRFTDSTLAYQGAARGLGEDLVLALDRIACRGLVPDLTICVDVDLETSLARARARNLDHVRRDRMDEQSVEFHRKVREAYRRLADREPQRVRVVDGMLPQEQLAEAVWRIVSPLLARRSAASPRGGPSQPATPNR